MVKTVRRKARKPFRNDERMKERERERQARERKELYREEGRWLDIERISERERDKKETRYINKTMKKGSNIDSKVLKYLMLNMGEACERRKRIVLSCLEMGRIRER